MEKITCRFCFGENTCLIKNQFDFFVCDDCDCIFNSKFLEGKKSLLNLDASQYQKKPINFFKKIISIRFWDLVALSYIKYLKTHTDMRFRTALDIGALYGHFVKRLNELNINAHGIEVDGRNAENAVSKQMTYEFFDEDYKSDHKYDLICFTQMIYYVANPSAILENATNLLTDTGLIFISTQNPNSSIIKNYELPIFEKNMNILLSQKNFENLALKLDLKIQDYTTLKPNIYVSRLKDVSKKSEVLNYCKYHFYPTHEINSNGHHTFLLLSKKP